LRIACIILRSSLFLSIWIAVSPFCVIASDPDKDHTEQWKEARTSDGVQTFFRWVVSDDGVTFRERKGEMEIQCSLTEAVKILSDAQHTDKWMTGIEDSKNLSRPGNNQWYTYTLFRVPWPFSKRDLVSLNRITTNHLQSVVLIDVICKENHLPLKPDVTRLTDYRAQWKITQLENNKIHLSIIAASSTPPAFPRYIQDPVIEKIFHNNLVRLKELLQQ
jgi:hypothetical protein